MKRVQHAVSVQVPAAVVALTAQLVDSSPDVGRMTQPISEVLVYSPGPVPCRCGRYLSQDFNGRLFCRGCEGTDPADITPRLPLCRRQP
jgi:hypothetical protein